MVVGLTIALYADVAWMEAKPACANSRSLALWSDLLLCVFMLLLIGCAACVGCLKLGSVVFTVRWLQTCRLLCYVFSTTVTASGGEDKLASCKVCKLAAVPAKWCRQHSLGITREGWVVLTCSTTAPAVDSIA